MNSLAEIQCRMYENTEQNKWEIITITKQIIMGPVTPVTHNTKQSVFSFTVTCRRLTKDWISQISILNLETKESIFTFKRNILLSVLTLQSMKCTYPEEKSKHPSYQAVNSVCYNDDLPGKILSLIQWWQKCNGGNPEIYDLI